jgi:hypothetical protein
MGCGSSAATPVAPIASNPRFMDISGPVKLGQDHFHESILVDQEVDLSSKLAETTVTTDIKGDGW